jgi:hypothetical protein
MDCVTSDFWYLVRGPIIKTTMGNGISAMIAGTGLRGRVDELDNRGDDIVGLEGTP